MQPFYTQYSNLLGEVEVGGIRKTPQLFQAACFTIPTDFQINEL